MKIETIINNLVQNPDINSGDNIIYTTFGSYIFSEFLIFL